MHSFLFVVVFICSRYLLSSNSSDMTVDANTLSKNVSHETYIFTNLQIYVRVVVFEKILKAILSFMRIRACIGPIRTKMTFSEPLLS